MSPTASGTASIPGRSAPTASVSFELEGRILDYGVISSGRGERSELGGTREVGRVHRLPRHLVPDSALILVPLDAKLQWSGRHGPDSPRKRRSVTRPPALFHAKAAISTGAECGRDHDVRGDGAILLSSRDDVGGVKEEPPIGAILHDQRSHLALLRLAQGDRALAQSLVERQVGARRRSLRRGPRRSQVRVNEWSQQALGRRGLSRFGSASKECHQKPRSHAFPIMGTPPLDR